MAAAPLEGLAVGALVNRHALGASAAILGLHWPHGASCVCECARSERANLPRHERVQMRPLPLRGAQLGERDPLNAAERGRGYDSIIMCYLLI